MKKYLSMWVVAALLIAPLPFCFSLFHFYSQFDALKNLLSEIERVHAKIAQYQALEKRESTLLSSFKHPDPHYLDTHVETLNFLLPEVKKLEALQAEHPEDERLSKQLYLLKNTPNRLLFSEEQIRTNDLFREIEENQQQPVDVNEEDLKRLLCLIEGVTIWPYGPKEGRPLFIIKDFKLSKKALIKDKVFTLSMQLIRRENLEGTQ